MSGKWVRMSFFFLLIVGAIVLVVFLFRSSSDTQQVNVSTILTDIKTDMNKGQQDTLIIGNDTITLTRGQPPNADKEAANINGTFDITTVLKDNGIDYTCLFY